MHFTLLKKVIDFLEEYEKEYPAREQQTILYFCAWLNQKVKTVPSVPPSQPRTTRPDFVEVDIGMLIFFLQRYARRYSKKALENTPLTTFDDFAYLATLLQHRSLTKVELIEKNIHEKTTGMEIIRRLLKNGLVEQRNDEVDKRSKRLTITSKGNDVLGSAFPKMRSVAMMIGGTLKQDEKLQLLYLLNKLHLFHNPIYQEGYAQSVDQLVEEKLKPISDEHRS